MLKPTDPSRSQSTHASVGKPVAPTGPTRVMVTNFPKHMKTEDVKTLFRVSIFVCCVDF